jgi:cobalt-zinc-cadmium efflux system outer membrane protein
LLQLGRAAIAAALVLHIRPARAETITIDLRGALDRAHRVSPLAAQIRGEIHAAEADVVGADVTFVTNPEIEAGAGPRFVPQHLVDVETRIAQDLEPGRRGPRRALAGARLLHARASADASLRELDLDVATAFYATVHADRVVELTKRTEDLAKRAADVADRRRRAGDVTDLDADLARAAAGRARSAMQAAAAERAVAAGKLAGLIGAAPGDAIVVTADLRQLTAPPLPPVGQRADLRALDADRRVGDAEHESAVADARPDLGIWLGYLREGGDSIVLGGLRVSLPTWNRKQGEQARAAAHASSAREQLDATTRAASREIADTSEAFARAREAVETYEHDVLPALDDAEQLLDKSIAAGQLAINEYLVERQELVSGRREYLDRLLALAVASVALRFAAGVSP